MYRVCKYTEEEMKHESKRVETILAAKNRDGRIDKNENATSNPTTDTRVSRLRDAR